MKRLNRLPPIHDEVEDPDLQDFISFVLLCVEEGEDDLLWTTFSESLGYREDRPDYRKPSREVVDMLGGLTVIKRSLAVLLPEGGIRRSTDENAFVTFPYYTAAFPFGLDPALHVVVTQPDARLFEQASRQSTVLRDLDYDILAIATDDRGGTGGDEFLPVSTLDGLDGYVLKRVVRSPLTPAFTFWKDATADENPWLLTSIDRLWMDHWWTREMKADS
jgi:hypothetical protein